MKALLIKLSIILSYSVVAASLYGGMCYFVKTFLLSDISFIIKILFIAVSLFIGWQIYSEIDN
jgi:hypothetical protein